MRIIRLGERAAKSTHPDPARRRIGRRQGTCRARDPGRIRPPGQDLRHRELRRAAGKSRRIDPLRARERRVHRRDRKARRQIPRGERRHAVPRRDRRTAAADAGEAAARAAGGRDRSGRRETPRARRHPAHLGDQPEPHRTRETGQVPRRSLLPAQRVSDHHPAAARRARATSPISRGGSRRASRPRKASACAA